MYVEKKHFAASGQSDASSGYTQLIQICLADSSLDNINKAFYSSCVANPRERGLLNKHLCGLELALNPCYKLRATGLLNLINCRESPAMAEKGDLVAQVVADTSGYVKLNSSFLVRLPGLAIIST